MVDIVGMVLLWCGLGLCILSTHFSGAVTLDHSPEVKGNEACKSLEAKHSRKNK